MSIILQPNMESTQRMDAPTTLPLLRSTNGIEYGRTTSQMADTQQHLASQLPLYPPSPTRPSSRDSIQSQHDNTEQNSAPYRQLQEESETRRKLVNPRDIMSIKAITEPSKPEGVRDTTLLLQCLAKTKSSKKRVSNQQSERAASYTARESFVSDAAGSQKDNGNQGQAVVSQSQSQDVVLYSQGQVTTPGSSQPELRPVSDLSEFPAQQANPIYSQPLDEVPSFQKVPTSSGTETSPIEQVTEDVISNVKTESNAISFRSSDAISRNIDYDRGPWDNMTKLHWRDVNIPEDQEVLLSRSDSWIPADIGQREPQGHVPPALLQAWNEKMTRIFLERRASVPSEKSNKLLEQEKEEPQPPSASERLSEDDSDSDPPTDWSQSPDEHLRPVRDRAPPDSPVRISRGLRLTEISKQDAKQTTYGVDRGLASEKASDVHFSVPLSSHTTCDTANAPKTDAATVDQIQSPGTSPAQCTVDVRSNELRPENEEEDPSNIGMKKAISQNCTVGSQNINSQTENTESTAPGSSIGDVPSHNSIPKDHDADPSDEEMETAIPQGLTTCSQSMASQINITESTAPSLSSTHPNSDSRVQIPYTPSSALGENAHQILKAYTNFQGSSNSDKPSSQVIANSIESSGNMSAQGLDLDSTQKSLILNSQYPDCDEQDPSLPSHQDSQRIPESSLNSADLHTQVPVANGELTGEERDTNSNPSMIAVSGVSLKRKAQIFDITDENPSKRPRNFVFREVNTITLPTATRPEHENAHRTKDREIFSTTPEGPKRIFQLFKKSYPNYVGDFDHFSFVCRRLQHLRNHGTLQQCLWDEYVMRYYGYASWETYEQYFHSNITQPTFKQRSLVPRTLDIVVPEQESLTTRPATTDKSTQRTVKNSVRACVPHQPTVTANLGNQAVVGTQTIPITIQDPVPMIDKPTQANLGNELNTSNATGIHRPFMVDAGIQANFEVHVSSKPQREKRRKTIMVEDRAIEETQQVQATDDEDDHMSDDESIEHPITDYHETASVELGVDSPGDEDYVEEEHDADYDGIIVNLISRMQGENQQAVEALRNSTIPELPHPAKKTVTFLKRRADFMGWATDDKQLAPTRRNVFLQEDRSRSRISLSERDKRVHRQPAKYSVNSGESTNPTGWIEYAQKHASKRRSLPWAEVSADQDSSSVGPAQRHERTSLTRSSPLNPFKRASSRI